MDLQKFYMGEVFDAYEYFGAHVQDGGVMFRTYAPAARGVTVMGEFSNWTEIPMEQQDRSGIWSVFSAQARPGQMYKYVIYGANGRQEHCDPYGFGMELRPGFASIIRDLKEYQFGDDEWMESRTRDLDGPMNIYEIHFGSWKMPDGKWPTYTSIADDLIAYLKEYGYNYVEFMPLSEHPFDGSWGYQNTGFFAPTSRYGTAAQLMELIDRLHQAGIGAIMDFVPVHFAVDGYGLKLYDGTPLYEYPNPAVGESEWGSCNFMHSRREVACFLQSAANYWLAEYHIDGLRMDAVSRLIYWQGDEHRGENGVTINFLKTMNRGLHALHPTAVLIAEDSTSYPGVTKPVEEGGLGFDYKWDLGWMNDTLDYMMKTPLEKESLSVKITFSIYYAYKEHYVLPLSHDEVVHGKRTIVDKMYGEYEQKFAQARTLYLYMMTHPGKKLNFMGNELGMFREFDETRELDWTITDYPMHAAFHRFIGDLNRTYLLDRALWELDVTYDGFKWIDCRTDNPDVFAYARTAKDGTTDLALFNFSDREAQISPFIDSKESAPVSALLEKGKARLLLNTDWKQYGGASEHGDSGRIPDRVAGYSAMLLKLD